MITDEMLRKAAGEADDALQKEAESLEECTHQFSGGFERKMKKLIWRANHLNLYRVRKIAVCIILMLLVGGSAVLTFNATAENMLVRNKFIGWMKIQGESDVHYYARKHISAKEMKSYRLGYIPEGYEEVERYEKESEVWICYVDSEGRYLHFSYMNNSSNRHVFVTQLEQLKQESVRVAGNPADFYESQDEDISSDLIWVDEDTRIFFSISGYFSREELIRLAESVQEGE